MYEHKAILNDTSIGYSFKYIIVSQQIIATSM